MTPKGKRPETGIEGSAQSIMMRNKHYGTINLRIFKRIDRKVSHPKNTYIGEASASADRSKLRLHQFCPGPHLDAIKWRPLFHLDVIPGL